MFSVTTPYTEISSVQLRLTSFAIQIVEQQWPSVELNMKGFSTLLGVFGAFM
jgi:hypothetical protein